MMAQSTDTVLSSRGHCSKKRGINIRQNRDESLRHFPPPLSHEHIPWRSAENKSDASYPPEAQAPHCRLPPSPNARAPGPPRQKAPAVPPPWVRRAPMGSNRRGNTDRGLLAPPPLQFWGLRAFSRCSRKPRGLPLHMAVFTPHTEQVEITAQTS